MKKLNKLGIGLISCTPVAATLITTSVILGIAANQTKLPIVIEKGNGVGTIEVTPFEIGDDVVITYKLYKGYSLDKNELQIFIDGQNVKASESTWILEEATGTIIIKNVQSKNIKIKISAKENFNVQNVRIDFEQHPDTYIVVNKVTHQEVTYIDVPVGITYQDALSSLTVEASPAIVGIVPYWGGEWEIDGEIISLESNVTSDVTLVPRIVFAAPVQPGESGQSTPITFKIWKDAYGCSYGSYDNNKTELIMEDYDPTITIGQLTEEFLADNKLVPFIGCKFEFFSDENGGKIDENLQLGDVNETLYENFDVDTQANFPWYVDTVNDGSIVFDTSSKGFKAGDEIFLIIDSANFSEDVSFNSEKYLGLVRNNNWVENGIAQVETSTYSSSDVTYHFDPILSNDGLTTYFNLLDQDNNEITWKVGKIGLKITLGKNFVSGDKIVFTDKNTFIEETE